MYIGSLSYSMLVSTTLTTLGVILVGIASDSVGIGEDEDVADNADALFRYAIA